MKRKHNRYYLRRGGMRLSLSYVYGDVKVAALKAKESAGYTLTGEEKDYIREASEKRKAYEIIARCFKKHGYDRVGRALYARLDKWGFVHV